MCKNALRFAQSDPMQNLPLTFFHTYPLTLCAESKGFSKGSRKETETTLLHPLLCFLIIGNFDDVLRFFEGNIDEETWGGNTVFQGNTLWEWETRNGFPPPPFVPVSVQNSKHEGNIQGNMG